MQDTVAIFCKNTGQILPVPIGSDLLSIYQAIDYKLPFLIANARVNNKTEGLSYRVYNRKTVEFVDISTQSGMRTYVRSLCFILYKAATALYPDSKVFLEHSVSKGYYCELEIGKTLETVDIDRIRAKMQDIIAQDLPFERVECLTSDAVKLFAAQRLFDKVLLLETTGALYTHYYMLDDLADFYYGSLLPSTGYIYLFDIQPYNGGILLVVPNRKTPTELETVTYQPKLTEIFQENLKFNHILGLNNIGDLNTAVLEHNRISELIKVSEALHEKRIARIADDVAQLEKRVVLISGPSSSGKTTFCKRLSIQLMTNLKDPVALSLDNYFVEREQTPLDEFGEYDYESLYALDLELFNEHLARLLNHEVVEMPTYNFTTGKREYKGNKLQLKDNSALVMEGIHALNPELTHNIAHETKYGVYVSALTSISIDDHNWIPTTDNRLIRRIIRDFRFRGYSAMETIRRWESVRRGEDNWIFPYQENADAMFNSALLFELPVLRRYAEPILESVPQNCPEYSEAYRLLKFLRYFSFIPIDEIPQTSLLREFFGGSSFEY
ncbi:MAG: nucleoside kinase [Bacteroidales bacterium]|jgi:uridine kinase|nr:nucleoside kinase [Bacteroidales bacterium]